MTRGRTESAPATEKRAELLHMVRTMSESCLHTSHWAISTWYRANLDKQAAAELAALKASLPDVSRGKRVKIGGNVVAFRDAKKAGMTI